MVLCIIQMPLATHTEFHPACHRSIWVTAGDCRAGKRFELFALFTWLFVLFTFITNYMGALRQAGKGKCVTAGDGMLLLGWRALGAEVFALDAAVHHPILLLG